MAKAKNWQEFLDEIKQAKTDLYFQKNEECFYRGHADRAWELSPGLFRGISATQKEMIPEPLWEIESDLYYEFRSRARELYENNMTDWDVLFFMQHHGVRTRLLDWTESFGTALYFALMDSLNADCKEPCIWVMNPYAFNQQFHSGSKSEGGRELWAPENLDDYDPEHPYSYSELLLGEYGKENGEMFYWDEPVALYPERRDNRLTAQGGYFTIHGNNIQSIEKLPGHQSFLRKVEIPKAAFADARGFLELANINYFTLFPDLDGLAKYLNSKYF